MIKRQQSGVFWSQCNVPLATSCHFSFLPSLLDPNNISDKEKGQVFPFLFHRAGNWSSKWLFSLIVNTTRNDFQCTFENLAFSTAFFIVYLYFFMLPYWYPIREAEQSGNHLQFSHKQKLRSKELSIILEEFFKRSLWVWIGVRMNFPTPCPIIGPEDLSEVWYRSLWKEELAWISINLLPGPMCPWFYILSQAPQPGFDQSGCEPMSSNFTHPTNFDWRASPKISESSFPRCRYSCHLTISQRANTSL